MLLDVASSVLKGGLLGSFRIIADCCGIESKCIVEQLPLVLRIWTSSSLHYVVSWLHPRGVRMGSWLSLGWVNKV